MNNLQTEVNFLIRDPLGAWPPPFSGGPSQSCMRNWKMLALRSQIWVQNPRSSLPCDWGQGFEGFPEPGVPRVRKSPGILANSTGLTGGLR